MDDIWNEIGGLYQFKSVNSGNHWEEFQLFPQNPKFFKQIFTVKSLGKCITPFSHTRLDSNPPVDASNTSWHA